MKNNKTICTIFRNFSHQKSPKTFHNGHKKFKLSIWTRSALSSAKLRQSTLNYHTIIKSLSARLYAPAHNNIFSTIQPFLSILIRTEKQTHFFENQREKKTFFHFFPITKTFLSLIKFQKLYVHNGRTLSAAK